MSAIDTRQEITIKLPSDVADFLRAKVSSGEYASESEFVEAAIVDSVLGPRDEGGLVHWINTEGARRCAALDADPSSGLTVDEAFAGLIDEDFDEIAKPS